MRPALRLSRVALAALFAAGSAAASELEERGAELFDDCIGCHSVGKGAEHRVGPHLNGIYGRKAAGMQDYDLYSDDMRRAGADGLVWDAEKLDIYVTNPQYLVTGTRMSYDGMEDPADREALLAYLRMFSDNPGDIPEAAPTATGRQPEIPPEILAIVGDPDYGQYLSGECVTCHQASGANEGIPSITGWPAEDFVIVMQSYKREYRVHPVMQMIAGRLSDEEIAALAAYFNGVR